ncbi:MAG TPA: hypothetical protein VGB83_01205 [Actinomycetota bacterium]
MGVVRRIAATVLLLLTLGACDLTVRLDTALEADGSGTFTIGMDLDRELRDLLASESTPESGMRAIEDLYDGLEAAGWEVSTADGDAGLSYVATRAFDDESGFDRALAELSGARGGGARGLGGFRLEIDEHTEQSFLQSRSTFSAVVDTSQVELTEIQRALRDLIASQLHFEIRASLPGAIREVEGSGVQGDGEVVWRPAFGERVVMAASSSAPRIGSLLLILVPSLILLALLGWFLLGRRSRRLAREDQQELLVLTDPATITLEAPAETIDRAAR